MDKRLMKRSLMEWLKIQKKVTAIRLSNSIAQHEPILLSTIDPVPFIQEVVRFEPVEM
ncbi:MAG: hypothetical protein Q8L02_05835 [Candidatus Nitrotoga sp.]|nr:hypothetical protein [Candidatus Nitrotoga sp.]